eukprot:7523819-Pyramimonas_sp.AAC.1
MTYSPIPSRIIAGYLPWNWPYYVLKASHPTSRPSTSDAANCRALLDASYSRPQGVLTCVTPPWSFGGRCRR